MGKLLERIIAERISQATETYSLLPDFQMGARKSRSATTAIDLTQQIHTIWAQDPGLVASVLSLALERSVIRNTFQKDIPDWISVQPKVDLEWSACRQTIEGMA